jgi:hypothetical protein
MGACNLDDNPLRPESSRHGLVLRFAAWSLGSNQVYSGEGADKRQLISPTHPRSEIKLQSFVPARELLFDSFYDHEKHRRLD